MVSQRGSTLKVCQVPVYSTARAALFYPGPSNKHYPNPAAKLALFTFHSPISTRLSSRLNVISSNVCPDTPAPRNRARN
ncbi:hypothetical protein Hypma_000661 [Hypsizygus marmoreus]|uniref:Uncharacterized protein n=1 Tax=Hypsizygus marmoreus TaxID=39966 RepID=A0A369J863_HYPMA|nr:hypothetical protein Hypma_000661 [Hypsizygus marmoreus]